MNNFFADENGNIAIITAVCLTAVLCSVGIAIDASSAFSAQKKIQNASDMAAFTAAVSYQQSGTENMANSGVESFQYNIQEIPSVKIEDKDIKVTFNGSNHVVVEVDAVYITLFSKFIGKDKVPLSVKSIVNVGDSAGMEIAIAFDSTVSVSTDGTWVTAMNAVEQTLESLKQSTQDGDFYLTFIPFQDYVNIGTDKSSWTTGALSASWTGCVEPREVSDSGYQWSLNDDTPFQDPFIGAPDNKMGWSTSSEPKQYEYGCPNVPITGPTSNVNTVMQSVSDMTSGGTGRLDVGLAWAWRALSPNWKYDWSVSGYPSEGSESRKKIAIYMSDGRTSAYKNSMDGDSSWGYSLASQTGMVHFEFICDRMKADDIEIYVLQLEGNHKATEYFQRCATSAEHYSYLTGLEGVPVVFEKLLTSEKSNLRLVE